MDPFILEYCIIALTRKILKLEGRMFSLHMLRVRTCILGHASKLMSKCNTSQAMTINELQKFNKMYILSRLNTTNCDYLYISIDVEAWNNNFRRTCKPIGREFFDKIFNMDHYELF